MPLKLIVFDCDGVILESVDIKSRVFYDMALRVSQPAADGLLAYHLAHGGVNRQEKFAWLFDNFVGRPITATEKEQWSREFQERTSAELLSCPLVPGIMEVLDLWWGRLPMYVASGSSQTDLRHILAERGLARYFEGIYGFPPTKEKILSMILEKANVRAEEALMVGDSSTDLIAAEVVGLKFYGRGQIAGNSRWPWYDDLSRFNDDLAADSLDSSW